MTQTDMAVSNTIMRSWEAHSAALDRIMERDERTRLGIDVYRDPATGTECMVANTY